MAIIFLRITCWFLDIIMKWFYKHELCCFFLGAFQPYLQQNNLITYHQTVTHCTVYENLFCYTWQFPFIFNQFQVSVLDQQHISWFFFLVKTCNFNILWRYWQTGTLLVPYRNIPVFKYLITVCNIYYRDC